ncbi:ComF family protein [Desulfobacterales bacterium HSG17]|nr:ComF family protein [Desulfobacterales bacterium HSG17]
MRLINLKEWLAAFFRGARECIFPLVCAACQKTFAEPRHIKANEPTYDLRQVLCPECCRRLSFIVSPLCSGCGIPFATDTGPDHLCGKCHKESLSIIKIRSAMIYGNPVSSLVQALKYKSATRFAPAMGRTLFQTFQQYWQPGEIDVIIPIPLHRDRRRRRGYNQSDQLLRPWPKLLLNSRFKTHIPQIVYKAISRPIFTPPQTGLDRADRLQNLASAFSVLQPEIIKGKNILLMDDVYTTGTTLNECGQELLKNGARSIHALTLARSLPGHT